MRLLLKYLLPVFFACHCFLASAQNETKRWVFGNNASLDFSSSPPSALPGSAMASQAACASVADAAGNLLFYTNGVKVWNQSHLVMANGSGLMGDQSSSQGALIVKQPAGQSIYYVFTTDGGSSGLRVSVVDMSLAAGMGSVTVKNQLVYAPSSERLCATRHCNGIDTWVVSHDQSSYLYRAVLVTAAGVSSTAVTSAIGTGVFGANTMGCMKISPNGKKLGAARYALPFAFELFDFNTATGVLTNSLSLPVSAPAYGCEFSPDGSKFYGSLWGANSIVTKLRQWDLCSGSNPAILASETTFGANRAGQLQLGPDGKIYQARGLKTSVKVSPELYVDVIYGESMIGVIHNPDEVAGAINFNNTALAVSPGKSVFGLPNFVSGFYKTPVAQFNYSLNPAAGCQKVFFTAPALINASCSATSYTISSVKWFFGDPATGAANSSVLLNPSHVFTDASTYDVKLVLYNACNGVIDTLKQKVAVSPAWLNSVSNFSICEGGSVTLSAGGASNSYSWSTGATTPSIVVTPSSSSTYSLSYTDAFGCVRKSVQTLTVNALPQLNLSGKNLLCEGATTTLSVAGAVLYYWSNNSTQSNIVVTPTATTVYSVQGVTAAGCNTIKSVTVTVQPAPVPAVTGNTVVCAGSVGTITAVGNDNYSWNTGMTGPVFTVVPLPDQYIFSVKATYPNGCGRFGVVRFKIKPVPFVTVAGVSTVCIGEVTTMRAKGAPTYSWSNGMTTGTVVLKPLVNTLYSVTGTDTNQCSTTKSVFVVVKPSAMQTGAVSGNVSICQGQKAYLSSTGGNQFLWQSTQAVTDQTNSSIVVSPSVSAVYSVNISVDFDCGITKTILVTVKPTPQIFAGRDTSFNLEEPMFLTASGTGRISWVSGDGIACSDCPNTQIFPTRNTCYIAQSVFDNGCIASDEVCVDVGNEFALYMPNTFTPNGDGLNDQFFVSGFGLSNVSLSIFNRWGERVFNANKVEEGWDGSCKGQPCEAGVYNWFIAYNAANGRRLQKSGSITILR